MSNRFSGAWSVLFVLSSLAVSSVGCDPQGEGPGPLELISTFPADQATGVSIYTPVLAGFTHAIQPAPAGVQYLSLSEVTSGGGRAPVAGSVSAVATGLVLYPSQPLKPLTQYEARVQGSITSLETEEVIEADRVWTFTTTTAAESGDEDTTPPFIVRTVPSSGELSVDPTASIEITFSEEISAASVTEDRYYLEDETTLLPVEFSVSRPSATRVVLTPAAPLEGGITYRVDVLAEVSDVAGNPMGSDQSIRFRVSRRSWSAGAPDPHNALRWKSGFVVTPSGDVVRVNDAGSSMKLHRINIASTLAPFSMGEETQISSFVLAPGFSSYTGARIATDSNGNLSVLWGSHNPGGTGELWAVYHSRANNAWTGPFRVAQTAGVVDDAETAIDSRGLVHYFWNLPAAGGATSRIYTLRYNPSANTWSTPSMLPTLVTNVYYGEFKVAFDGQGNGLLASHAYAGTTNYVMPHYWNGTAWSTLSVLNEGNQGVSDVQVATDSIRGFMVAWEQTVTRTVSGVTRTFAAILANRYDGNASRGVVTVEDEGLSSSMGNELRLVGNSRGEYHALYRKDPRVGQTSSPDRLIHAMYRPGRGSENAGWLDFAPVAISDAALKARQLEVVMNPAGQGFVAYTESVDGFGESNTVRVRQYDAAIGAWSAPAVDVGGSTDSQNSNLRLAIGADGHALLLWDRVRRDTFLSEGYFSVYR